MNFSKAFKLNVLPVLLGVKDAVVHLMPVKSQHKCFTEQELKLDIPSNKRFNKKFGITFDTEKCTVCRDCEKVCPPKAISIESDTDLRGISKVVFFKVDFSKCTLCRICVEVCPENCVNDSENFKESYFNKNDLLVEMGSLTNTKISKDGRIEDKLSKIRSYELRR